MNSLTILTVLDTIYRLSIWTAFWTEIRHMWVVSVCTINIQNIGIDRFACIVPT